MIGYWLVPGLWIIVGKRLTWFASEDLEVVALPPTPDNHVQLLVKNLRETQEFVADALDFRNIETNQERYKLKWREDTTGCPERTIFAGGDDVLDVAQITTPDMAPFGLINAHSHGSFRLFSVKLPSGWEVHAGPSGWIPLAKVLRQVDPFDEYIALRIRVSGSKGISRTRRVTLGFSREPLSNGSGATVQVDDWPAI